MCEWKCGFKAETVSVCWLLEVVSMNCSVLFSAALQGGWREDSVGHFDFRDVLLLGPLHT